MPIIIIDAISPHCYNYYRRHRPIVAIIIIDAIGPNCYNYYRRYMLSFL